MHITRRAVLAAAAMAATPALAQQCRIGPPKHNEMAETLGNPYGPNGRAALAMMGLGTR